jgi:hypothetical protein
MKPDTETAKASGERGKGGERQQTPTRSGGSIISAAQGSDSTKIQIIFLEVLCKLCNLSISGRPNRTTVLWHHMFTA